MDSRDERDAELILLTIESEFRRTLEAEQTFMAWRRDTPNAPFVERLRWYAAWAEAERTFCRELLMAPSWVSSSVALAYRKN